MRHIRTSCRSNWSGRRGIVEAVVEAMVVTGRAQGRPLVAGPAVVVWRV